MAAPALVTKAKATMSFTTTEAGAVPAPGTTTGKYLEDDGTWSTPAGGGSAKVFDVFVPTGRALYPSTAPARKSRNGHPVWAFDDTTDESIILLGVMGAGYGAGSINVKIQWAGDGVTTGAVKWDVQWERMNTALDLDADSFNTLQTATTTTAGTDGQTVITTISFTQAQADGITANDAYRLKVTRDANAGGDTMAADAQAVRVWVEEQ